MDFSIKNSPIHGVGLFAQRDFPIYTKVLECEGNPKELIYLNHSCNPTCYLFQPDEDNMQTHILYSKGIQKGEEITIDYRFAKIHHELWEKTISKKCRCELCID